jgi:hypothetical protein
MRRSLRIAVLVLPFTISCTSGGPGDTASTGAATGNPSAGGVNERADGEPTEPEETATSNAPDGISFTIEGKTYTFAAQQQALPLETYLFLRTSESDASEYPWVGLRAYTNTKGSYPCVEGGTVLWYARSETESYSSTSCVINIRELGGLGEIIEGDFSGTFQQNDIPGNVEDFEPKTLAITRATFHMTARRSE